MFLGISIVGYWSVGWALAYGPAENDVWGNFFGYSEFFLSGQSNYARFFFQYVFADTAATILTGAVAERSEMVAYFVYCALISCKSS